MKIIDGGRTERQTRRTDWTDGMETSAKCVENCAAMRSIKHSPLMTQPDRYIPLSITFTRRRLPRSKIKFKFPPSHAACSYVASRRRRRGCPSEWWHPPSEWESERERERLAQDTRHIRKFIDKHLDSPRRDRRLVASASTRQTARYATRHNQAEQQSGQKGGGTDAAMRTGRTGGSLLPFQLLSVANYARMGDKRERETHTHTHTACECECVQLWGHS